MYKNFLLKSEQFAGSYNISCNTSIMYMLFLTYLIPSLGMQENMMDSGMVRELCSSLQGGF